MPQTAPATSPAAQAFLHLEIVHVDPEAVFAFLRTCLGAERVEQEISESLEKGLGFGPILHARVGNIVFQIVKPPPTILGQPASWFTELEERGPGVHNVTFYVNDAAAVKERMMARGATEVVDVHLPFHEVGLGVGPTRLLVMDAREQAGLRFEMVEPIEGWIPLPSGEQT